jgi:hypothetical protein
MVKRGLVVPMLYPTLDYMIKANELRIGNWIMDRGGKMWQIDHWEEPDVVATKQPIIGDHPVFGTMYGHPLTEYITHLQPIPLTPEILEKAGFTKMGGSFSFREFTITANYDLIIDGSSYDYTGVYWGKIEYLHRLQNIIHSLTGDELTIDATLHSQATTEEK